MLGPNYTAVYEQVSSINVVITTCCADINSNPLFDRRLVVAGEGAG